MNKPRPLDGRDAEALLAGIAGRLAAADPAAQAWLRALAEPATPQRPARLRHGEEATSALLAGAAAAFSAVIARFDRLPDDLRHDYVTRHLGLRPAPAVPDRIIVDFPAHEVAEPLVLPAGSGLASDAQGAGRRYRSDEALTLLPWRLTSLYGYRQVGAGRDRFVRHAVADGALVEPVTPFGDDDDQAVVWAACQWYLCSAGLAAARRGTRLTIRLVAAGPSPESAAEALLGVDWSVSTADGALALPLAEVGIEGRDVVARLAMPVDPGIAAEAIPGLPPGLPWLRLAPRTAAAAVAARALTCGDVALSIDADDLPVRRFFADGQPLDPGAPFLPFGPTPSPGASFAIADDAVFALRLRHLAIEPVPADGALAVFAVEPTHNGGGLRWESLHGEAWQPLMPGTGAASATFGQTVGFDTAAHGVVAGRDPYTGNRLLRCRLADADFGWQRYLRRQQAFTVEVMAQAQRRESLPGRLLRALRTRLGRAEPAPAVPPAPPPPLRLSGARMSFRSQPLLLSTGELASLGAPDGLCPLPLGRDQDGRLAPFRGLGDCSLLILGLADGSEEQEAAIHLHLEARPMHGATAQLRLRYLDPLRGLVPLEVSDGTQGLRRSGFMRFHTPERWPAVPCPVLPAVRGPGDAEATHWLVLEADSHTVAERLLSLSLNAVPATGVIGAEAGAEAAAVPAPARLLLTHAISGISGASVVRTIRVAQPAESPQRFLARAAGACRHRQRAVAPWDVERLVRDRFPGIALVRCLRPDVDRLHAEANRLRVVVVPDADQRFPTLDAEVQQEIRAYLAGLGPQLAGIELLDPSYTEVAVEARVRARPGLVLAQVRADLEAALTRFLQPYSRSGGRQHFGHPVLLSRIRHFVAGQATLRAVDHLAFAGAHAGLAAVTPERPDGIITSARRHQLEVGT
jgi:hypothetical protein